MTESFWRRCSSCKTEIGFGRPYWTCSVTTCNRKGTDFVFCSLDCWEAHVPTLRHRDAWAEEKCTPEAGAASSPNASHAAATPSPNRARTPRDILIVASKLKAYIRARSGMNTSESVLAELSERVRDLCDDAIGRAREDGRKTLMDRDF